MSVEFNATLEETYLIKKILYRAKYLGACYDSHLSMEMDINAVHSNGTPLDLERLLICQDFDFHHDINGIYKHLDRKTGKLKDHFLPRCARG